MVDWSAYAWLGNQARADAGVLRAGMAVAMAAVFVVALTIPEAWQDAPGGLDGPLVLVGAYLVVRCVHLTLYTVAAAGDHELRRQLAITWAPLLASAALLIAGALLGGWTQTLLFAGALLAPLAGLAGLVLILAALILVETTRYAQTRRSLRGT